MPFLTLARYVPITQTAAISKTFLAGKQIIITDEGISLKTAFLLPE